MSKPVRIVFLGGLGEIGRNCACIEVDGRIMIIDCGLMFPEEDMPGVDLVLPDFTYLRENAERVDGCVITHGHEDHAGGLSFLLREMSFPIYGSALTMGLARNRIEEAGLLSKTELIPVADNERRRVGPFDMEFIPVTHSVPDGFAVAFHTPQGVVLHSGDFKIDLNPVDGRSTDLARIGQIAKEEGIRLLLCDSTNAEEEGHTKGEKTVGKVLEEVFNHHRDQRIIVACFASHIHRVQQIADVAVAQDRTIATLGRSMGKNVALARSMGLLSIPDRSLVDIDDIGDLAPEKTCIISTGSQGEPMSALALMAANDNRRIKVGEGDVVVLSSHAIPGNETSVGKVIDGLSRLGAEVIHSGLAQVHTSGHAKRDELRLLQSICSPDCFIPVHGEYRHLSHHARLAQEMGVDPKRILLAEDGDVVDLHDQGIDFAGEVPAGYLYVDGIVGDVGQGVLRDRRVLANEGVVMVVLTVDTKAGEIVTGPEIITRGWVYAPEAEKLLDEARRAVSDAAAAYMESGTFEVEALKRKTRQALGRFVQEKTKRRPMIVPVIMEA